MYGYKFQYYLNQFIALRGEALKSIPEYAFFVILGFFILFGAYFFLQWYKYFKLARNIEDTPRAKIRSAAQGYVEIEGKQKALSHHPIIAPLSRLPCTWYRYTIDQTVRKRWYRLEQAESTHAFVIYDETGESVIEPLGAKVTCALKDTWHGFSKYPNGKPSNIFMRLISLFGSYQYTEWRMEEGMYLYAAGNFATRHDDQTNQSYNTISKTGLDKKSPFLLSSLSQAKLIQSYKLAAFAFLVGYVIFVFIIGWMIVGRYF